MPGYKKHLSVAFILYGAVLAFFALRQLAISQAVEWLLFILLGALFPDIDIKSKGQLLFYHIVLLLLLYFFLTGQWSALIGLSLLSCMPLVVNHRGIFHNFAFILLVVLASTSLGCYVWPHRYIFLCYDACFFLLGVFSHLALDKGIWGVFKF